LGLGGVAVTSKYSVGALVGALMLAAGLWSYPANALTFQFSFNNSPSNDPAQSLVAGIITGLQDNQANQNALSVQVTSNPAGFGVGEYVPLGSPFSNFFSVSAGVITSANFLYFGVSNTSPAITCCTFQIDTFFGTGLSNFDEGVITNSTNLAFTAVAETPLPAALPLFATGIGGLGLLGWRRKKKAAALN
jgi:hypothetical protein